MGLVIMTNNRIVDVDNKCIKLIENQKHINNKLDNIQNQLDEAHKDMHMIKKKLKSTEESK